MRKAEYFMVLDTEGMSTERPFEVAYVITDRADFDEVEARAFYFEANAFANWQKANRTNERAFGMIERTLTALDGSKCAAIKADVELFRRVFEYDITKYHITKIYCYNAPFDKGALCRLLGEGPNFAQKSANAFLRTVDWRDLWSAAYWGIMDTKKYAKWAFSHGFVNEKGHVQTTAEACYNYLLQEVYREPVKEVYREVHEALADARLEKAILGALFDKKCKLRFEKAAYWRLLDAKLNG